MGRGRQAREGGRQAGKGGREGEREGGRAGGRQARGEGVSKARATRGRKSDKEG